jgi:hypothetical protein
MLEQEKPFKVLLDDMTQATLPENGVCLSALKIFRPGTDLYWHVDAAVERLVEPPADDDFASYKITVTNSHFVPSGSVFWLVFSKQLQYGSACTMDRWSVLNRILKLSQQMGWRDSSQLEAALSSSSA